MSILGDRKGFDKSMAESKPKGILAKKSQVENLKQEIEPNEGETKKRVSFGLRKTMAFKPVTVPTEGENNTTDKFTEGNATLWYDEKLEKISSSSNSSVKVFEEKRGEKSGFIQEEIVFES